MRRESSTADGHDAIAIRFAWWASFSATVALIAILGLARSAQALTFPSPESTGTLVALAPALDEELEDEDEAEAEASEDEELEAEECEGDEEEECEDEAGSEAPQECLLSSAQATIFASAGRDQVRLQVRYTTSSPTAVAVDYGLHGSKGSLYLGGDKKHFARRGVLHLTKSLTEAQMAKVMAAREFTVRLRVPAAPHYCQSLFDRQLDVRRSTPTGLVWQQSE
jgi:hypothetical protein